jgi:hypothetical protein
VERPYRSGLLLTAADRFGVARISFFFEQHDDPGDLAQPFDASDRHGVGDHDRDEGSLPGVDDAPGATARLSSGGSPPHGLPMP